MDVITYKALGEAHGSLLHNELMNEREFSKI
jgi:hypothetical protein